MYGYQCVCRWVHVSDEFEKVQKPGRSQQNNTMAPGENQVLLVRERENDWGGLLSKLPGDWPGAPGFKPRPLRYLQTGRKGHTKQAIEQQGAVTL